MFLLNNTWGRRYVEVYPDTPDVLFDLSDQQLGLAMNRDWYRIRAGSIACVIDPSRQLRDFYLISASTRAQGRDGEQAVITGAPIATLHPAQHYSDVLIAHRVSHKYLRDHKLVRGFNVAHLGDALDQLTLRGLDGSEISLGELKARYGAEVESRSRVPLGIPEGITREHVLWAIGALEWGVDTDFGESTRYDLIHEGRRYPPKAVLGLAARRVTNVDFIPEDFKGGEGSKAFRILRTLGFTIEPKTSEEVVAREAWSADELRALLAEYFFMLTEEQAGRAYDISARAGALQDALVRRSKAEIELQYRDVSAVLQEMDIPYVSAYPPGSNDRDALWVFVNEYLASSDALWSQLEQSYSQPLPLRQLTAADFASAQVPPPPARVHDSVSVRARPRQARRIDFRARDEANRALGRAGEQFILEYERWRLCEAGRADLAERVRWVSVEQGDGLGYDIASFETDETQIFIEVKTTKQSIEFPFLVSSNEVDASNEKGASYRLYRVFDFARRPLFYVRAGSLSGSFELRPTLYEARAKPPEAVSASRDDVPAAAGTASVALAAVT